jgi:hypothetical protein
LSPDTTYSAMQYSPSSSLVASRSYTVADSPPGPPSRTPAFLNTIDVEALKKAEDLSEVIDQVVRGDVKRIRDKYGPLAGRAPDPMWESMKVTVTRRERIYREFSEQFDGNKHRFHNFFTLAQADRGKGKRKPKNGGPALRSLRKAAGAIPNVRKAMKAEKAKQEYLDDGGSFCEVLWKEKWGDLNEWEVWRALGLEKYTNT